MLGRRGVVALNDTPVDGTPVEFMVELKEPEPKPFRRYRSGLERSTLNVPPSCRRPGRGAVSAATYRTLKRPDN